MTIPAPTVEGHVAAGFERVHEAFEANFARYGEVGAACCVYIDGRRVVDLTGGRFAPGSDAPYAADTLQLVASATKGALAICAWRLAERGELDLDAPVAQYWPEFAAGGKAAVPVRALLSHRVGLPYVDAELSLADLCAWEPAVTALAAQTPAWEPGTAHGYHALTFGWLVGEVLSRITGMTPGQLSRREIAEPLGLDLWVGLPDELLPRVSPLLPVVREENAPPDPLLLLIADPASLAHRAFFVRAGLLGAMNDRSLWAAQLPAANGIANARALATMYAACLDEVDGVQLLAPDTVRAAMLPQSVGRDLVIGTDDRFGTGFQLSFDRRPMAGDGSFGHYGLGGSVGFAHPEHGLAFGYVVNQMLPGSAVDPRSAALVTAVLACL
ncbi:MAG: serine hydrolase domain-containing protein [Sporichthyaceae bacterium]